MENIAPPSDIIDNQIPADSANSLPSEWLSADELSYNGVTIGKTLADELSAIVGAAVAEEPNIPEENGIEKEGLPC